jgi:hypothetical protein
LDLQARVRQRNAIDCAATIRMVLSVNLDG